MKQKVFNLFFISALYFCFTVHVSANTIPSNISVCFKTGNAGLLADFFYSNIELQILDNENVYSKTQAEQIVKRFFEQNKPNEFEILYQSGKDGSEYAIGTLYTNNGKFRVNFLIKTDGSKQYIHQLSIKKENG